MSDKANMMSESGVEWGSLRFGQIVSISQPPEPRWTMQLCGSADLMWRLVKAPNAFHRMMQRICLGIVWTPIKPKRT